VSVFKKLPGNCRNLNELNCLAARQFSLVVGLSDLATNFLQIDQQAGLGVDQPPDPLVTLVWWSVLGGVAVISQIMENHTVDGRYPAARYGTLYCK